MKRFLLHILLLPVIGCGGGAPSAPPPPAPPPDSSDSGVIGARDAERKRKMASASNTVLTGAQGVTAPPPLAVKTLLGA